MDITLYYAPHTCALAPYISLTEAGADFKVERVNLRKKQQFTDSYLAINPKHKVPSLVVDGRVLTENVAIHPWVARNFPQANLLPADPWDELKALSIHSWVAGGIHPFLARVNNPPKTCDVDGGPERVVEIATAALHDNFGVADEVLAGREYFFDHFTTPDAHFFWATRRAHELKVDLSRFKNVLAHFERMHARPSVKTFEAFEAEVIADFAKVA